MEIDLTGKGNDILDKAEDVILRGVEKLLEAPEKMTGEDCRKSFRIVGKGAGIVGGRL